MSDTNNTATTTTTVAEEEEAVLETNVSAVKRARDTGNDEEEARGDKKHASDSDDDDGPKITLVFSRTLDAGKGEPGTEGKNENAGPERRDMGSEIVNVIAAMQVSQMIHAHSLKFLKVKTSKPFQTFVRLRSMARTFLKIADTRGTKSKADKIMLDFFDGSGTLLTRIDRIYKACEQTMAARNEQALIQAKEKYAEYTGLLDKYTCPEHPHFEVLHERFVKGWSIVLNEVESQAAQK